MGLHLTRTLDSNSNCTLNETNCEAQMVIKLEHRHAPKIDRMKYYTDGCAKHVLLGSECPLHFECEPIRWSGVRIDLNCGRASATVALNEHMEDFVLEVALAAWRSRSTRKSRRMACLPVNAGPDLQKAAGAKFRGNYRGPLQVRGYSSSSNFYYLSQLICNPCD